MSNPEEVSAALAGGLNPGPGSAAPLEGGASALIPIALTDAWREFVRRYATTPRDEERLLLQGSGLPVGGPIVITLALETLLGISQGPTGVAIRRSWDQTVELDDAAGAEVIFAPPEVTGMVLARYRCVQMDVVKTLSTSGQHVLDGSVAHSGSSGRIDRLGSIPVQNTTFYPGFDDAIAPAAYLVSIDVPFSVRGIGPWFSAPPAESEFEARVNGSFRGNLTCHFEGEYTPE